MARFSMATSEHYTDKTSGKKIENTDWHDVVLWRGLAEITEKFLKKGMKVYVEGKLKKRAWKDKEGAQRYNVDIVADSLTILSKNQNTTKPSHSYTADDTSTITSKIEGIDAQNDDDFPF
jgi:single-strand DNA-binding protein